MTEFISFPKISRWSNQYMFITEKIDGTNAQIVINEDCTDFVVGSRSRFITPEADNYGFATWCQEHKEELLKLGKGQHFGEWWGKGVQRGYGLTEKRLSLFNTFRWSNAEQQEKLNASPASLVPILYQGPMSGEAIDQVMRDLRATGSKASPGYMDPEGIIIYLPLAKTLFKKTFGSDGHKNEEIM